MLSSPDAQMALSGVQDNDLAQRKLQMDALRGRLGDQRDQKEKLREACEGFESIFLQKMWAQMRATVPDEGYLHSKEEKFWQSMFDQELSKKMASAGGVGLGDMLFDQLAVTLLDASRVNTPSQADNTVPVRPLNEAPQAQQPLNPLAPPPVKGLSADDLYAPLDENPLPAPEVDTQGGLYDLASAVAAFDVNEAQAAETAPGPANVASLDVQTPIIIPASTQPATPQSVSPQPGNTRSGPQPVIPQSLGPQPLGQTGTAPQEAFPRADLAPESPLRAGVAPLDEGNHEAIMRRLAEIAYAARAPQAAIDQLNGQAPVVEARPADQTGQFGQTVQPGQSRQPEQSRQSGQSVPQSGQAGAAKLLTEETVAGVPQEGSSEEVMDYFTASRLGNPERVRTPQRSTVADAPIIQRTANSAPAPRMQHPSIRRGTP